MKKGKNFTQKENKFKIKVTKNGPYFAAGSIPLSEQSICFDAEAESHGWKEGRKYPPQESYSLCRCGHSRNKPFCDDAHAQIRFDGTEEASPKPYLEQAVEINGPDLNLTDAEDFCASARFCHRRGGIWKLTQQSDDPEAKNNAIEEAGDCPSGRLVAWDKKGKALEPKLEPSIGLVSDTQANKMGPIWVRGGVPVESADGKPYEVRNRVTLCRCGKSAKKPFCDGSHLK